MTWTESKSIGGFKFWFKSLFIILPIGFFWGGGGGGGCSPTSIKCFYSKLGIECVTDSSKRLYQRYEI